MLSPEKPSIGLVIDARALNERKGEAERTAENLELLLGNLQRRAMPVRALAEVIITHDGLSEAQREALAGLACVPVCFVQVPLEMGRYAAKHLGFEATTSDVVAFADAHCWPEDGWLEQLVEPFADPRVEVTAGSTHYPEDLRGTAATVLDYLADPRQGGARGFHTNNVAFRRDTFEAYRYAPADGLYQGHPLMVELRLRQAGVEIRFVPGARMLHRASGAWRDLARLRLLRAAEDAELALRLALARLPAPLRILGGVPVLSALSMLALRFYRGLRALKRQDPRVVRGRYLRCAAWMTALLLLDGVGTLGRPVVRAVLGGEEARPGNGTFSLSYHSGPKQAGEQAGRGA